MAISPPSGLVSSRSNPTASRPARLASATSCTDVASWKVPASSRICLRHELSTRMVSSIPCGA